MREPILITGAARSGTSMVAGAINICGAFGGKTSPGNINNQKGMYENARIRNTIVKPFFESIGADKLGQYPLPDVNNLVIPNNWRRRVEQVIKEDGYSDGPWFYKGAKMCLTWPVWDYAFPNAKWIIVRRKTSEIINSCQKTAFMRAFRNRSNQHAVGAKNEWEGWLWWVHEHENRFVEMIQAGLNCKIVWSPRLVDGDYTQLMEAIEWLGLDWNNKVVNFIDPKLWKQRKKVMLYGKDNSDRG